MKRLVKFLCLSLALCLLTACGHQGGQSSGLKSNPVWMMYEEAGGIVKSPEGKNIFEYHYYKPVLRTEGTAADYINNKLDNANTAFVYGETGIDGLTKKAQREYQAGWFSCYQRSRYIDEARIDDTVLSLVYEDTIYTGGLQAQVSTYGMNFDLNAGTELRLGSLTEDETALRTFCTQYILSELKTADYRNQLYANYDQRISGILDNWCLTDEGLCFIAQPYTISPGSETTYYFTVPYAELQGKIGMKWMPGPFIGSSGDVSVSAGTGPAQFAVQADGDVYSFTPNGNLYDFSIERVKAVWEGRQNVYEPVNQLLYSPVVGDGQSFTVQLRLPENVPNLLVRYKLSDGSDAQFFLMNRNGQPVLEAVPQHIPT